MPESIAMPLALGGCLLRQQSGQGDADDKWEATLRTLANDDASAINEAGDI